MHARTHKHARTRTHVRTHTHTHERTHTRTHARSYSLPTLSVHWQASSQPRSPPPRSSHLTHAVGLFTIMFSKHYTIKAVSSYSYNREDNATEASAFWQQISIYMSFLSFFLFLSFFFPFFFFFFFPSSFITPPLAFKSCMIHWLRYYRSKYVARVLIVTLIPALFWGYFYLPASIRWD